MACSDALNFLTHYPYVLIEYALLLGLLLQVCARGDNSISCEHDDDLASLLQTQSEFHHEQRILIEGSMTGVSHSLHQQTHSGAHEVPAPLQHRLGTDLVGASVVATLVTPVIQVLDVSVIVEMSKSQANQMGSALLQGAFAWLTDPYAHVATVAFWSTWLLYLLTYATANAVRTLCLWNGLGVDSRILIWTSMVNGLGCILRDVVLFRLYATESPTSKAEGIGSPCMHFNAMASDMSAGSRPRLDSADLDVSIGQRERLNSAGSDMSTGPCVPYYLTGSDVSTGPRGCQCSAASDVCVEKEACDSDLETPDTNFFVRATSPAMTQEYQTPWIVYMLLIFREVATMASAFVFPGELADRLFHADVKSHTFVVCQLLCPALMQLFITPSHLLAIDYCNVECDSIANRWNRCIQKFKEVWFTRILRGFVLFGVGGVGDTELLQALRGL